MNSQSGVDVGTTTFVCVIVTVSGSGMVQRDAVVVLTSVCVTVCVTVSGSGI